MADPLPWPSVLQPSSEDWSLRGGTRSGGQTFQGNEQVIASPTARWKASLNIPCFGRDKILAMRRVIALGRSQIWYVGPYERGRAPWPVEPILGGLLTDRDAGAPQPVMDFSLAVAAGMNDAAITIRRDAGNYLAAGMIFSIGSRLHVITAITGADPGSPSSGLAVPGGIDIEIRPWLRADYAADTPIYFATPVGVMRLASDDTASMELQLSRYGTVTVELVEAF